MCRGGGLAAPGFRHHASSVLSHVGNNGSSWSSTVSSTNGVYFGFGVAWLDPNSTYSRASGFQLRCLSE
ncbi:hypothetical protein [uncultured Rikenella sp.]|uniref:hypothetical protein n=1 Tax=uncultured Rikenella sp. TaxID=368003 RepID=UPI0025D16FC8|nr:hypothetical protein [uncultured Rikenella sp.]